MFCFKVFPSNVWFLIYSTLAILSACLALNYNVESELENKAKRTRPDWFDYVTLVVSRFLESDPLPWFGAWNSSRILLFLWMYFALFTVFFFQSNLRSILMVNGYEKAFVTNSDIINLGKRIYLVNENFMAKYEHTYIEVKSVKRTFHRR